MPRTIGDTWREIEREVRALFTDEPICGCGRVLDGFDPDRCPKGPDGHPSCVGYARLDAAYDAAEAKVLGR